MVAVPQPTTLNDFTSMSASSTIIGGTGVAGFTNGPAMLAQINTGGSAGSCALSNDGNTLYFIDYNNNYCIRAINNLRNPDKTQRQVIGPFVSNIGRYNSYGSYAAAVNGTVLRLGPVSQDFYVGNGGVIRYSNPSGASQGYVTPFMPGTFGGFDITNDEAHIWWLYEQDPNGWGFAGMGRDMVTGYLDLNQILYQFAGYRRFCFGPNTEFSGIGYCTLGWDQTKLYVNTNSNGESPGTVEIYLNNPYGQGDVAFGPGGGIGLARAGDLDKPGSQFIVGTAGGYFNLWNETTRQSAGFSTPWYTGNIAHCPHEGRFYYTGSNYIVEVTIGNWSTGDVPNINGNTMFLQ